MPNATPTTSTGLNNEIAALRAELAQTKSELAEAQEVLRAIQSGEVDALVVSSEEGERVFTLKGAESAYRVLVEAMNEGAAMLDAHGTVLYCNQSLATLVEIPLEKIVGNAVSGVFASPSRSTILELVAKALAGEAPKCELELQVPNGRRVPVYISLRQINDEEHTSLCMVATDITARKHVEMALLESEEHLRQQVEERTAQLQQANSGLLMEVLERKRAEEAAQRLATIVESTDDAIASNTLDGAIATWNRAAERLYGYTEAEAVGQSMMMLVPRRFRDELKELVQRVAHGAHVAPLETVRVRKDGSLVDVQVTHSAIKDAWGKVIGVATIVRDITERKQADHKLRKLNRTLKATSNSDHALLHAETEEALLQRVCSIITEDCGHEMVWIGFAEDDDEKTVSPVVHAGFDKGYLETLRITWADTERGRGPTGMAIRTGQPCVCRNILTDPRFKPWRDEAIKRGYASSLVLPLMEDGKAFGAVTIYSAEADAFLEDEVKLLLDLTADLAHGIRTLRERAARERAEEVLRQNRAKLDAALASMTDAVFIADSDGQVLEFNDAFTSFCRFKSKAECVRTFVEYPRLFDLWMANGEPAPLEMWAVPRALRGETSTNTEYTLRRKDTGESWVGNYSFAPIRDEGGAIVGCVVTARDITERKRAEEALYRFELMAGHTRDIILFMRHADGCILEANEAAAKEYGYSREELKTMTIHALRAPSTRPLVLGEMAVAEMQGTLFESLHLRADGSIFPVEVSSKGATISGVRTLISIVRDITERKHADTALRESEERYRTLFSTLIEGFSVIEMIFDSDNRPIDYRFLVFNPAFENQTGLHGAQGKLVRDLVPDLEAHWFDIYGRVALTGEPARFENEARALNRWYEVSAYRVGGTESRKVATLFNDITERKRSEEASRRSEERLASIVGSAMDAIITLDENLNILVFNEAAEKIFRCTASEVLGKPIDRFLPARFQEGHRGHIHTFGTTGVTARSMYSPATLYGQRADGEEFPVEATISQATAGGQKLYTVILRDITQRKKSEEVARMYAQSKELDELKTEFFANISHELRTPLTLILGPVKKRLASSGISAEERRDLELVERNARLLLRHVKDLLDLSKLDAGKMKASYAEADLAVVARLVASNFDSLAGERGLDFKLEIPDFLPAQVDTPKVERILVNLLSNAFKFTPAGGRVRFALYSRDGHAAFEVGDTGPGIPMLLRDAIFERFRQVESGANRRFGGTGLGLSIVKQFVNLHGGSITVGEEQGSHGALFHVELPLRAPAGSDVQHQTEASEQEDVKQVVEELKVRSASQPELALELPASIPLVLIVEDNQDMNAFLTDTLATTYRTASAFDGQEGLQKAAELHPDLILSDMMMPVMSGDQLVREVRKRHELDDVPIVLLTAKADDRTLVQALKEGAQEYLQKPFVAEQLLAKMERLIADRKRTADELERLRNLSGHLLQADDQERREIAHELHEDVAQNLTALRMRLSLAANSDASMNPAVHRILAEGLTLLELCCSGISAMSIALHPSVLEHFGLEPAISGYAQRFAQIEGIQVQLNLRAGLGRLPAVCEVTLFRILQDALSNVRASGSKEATVRLHRDAEEVELEVIHNALEAVEGKAPHTSSALGITAMRERVRLFGGRLEISTVGTKTTIRAIVPLETRDRART